ncbi:MAG TPA: FAD-dependent oxidoreductase, partial [Mycobacterium sp.]|nr:FAD-dependent oxidoreductase [Mycobacterium sp.]
MTENNMQFDVVVIGAGAGGLFTAARLAHRGYRTLVIERLDKVGGRASTDDIDGFKVNNGAIVIEVGGITQQTCEEVGAPFDIREPSPPILYRIAGKDVDVTGGGWGFLLGKLTRQGAKLVKGIGAARSDSGLPEDEMTTAEWVSKYTKNEGVHGIFRNMCASVFAVGSEDLPARVFLTYFTRKSAFKRFGFHPEGTIGLWRALANVVTSHGGEVWLSTAVTKIVVDGEKVTGVHVERDGETIEIASAVVVSDLGPAASVALIGADNVPDDYKELVERGNRPTAMISVNFASQDRLVDVPGMLSFARS